MPGQPLDLFKKRYFWRLRKDLNRLFFTQFYNLPTTPARPTTNRRLRHRYGPTTHHLFRYYIGQYKGGCVIKILLITTLLGLLMAAAGSSNGAVYAGLPVFALCILLAFATQWLAFVPAYLRQTEKFYDLTGSITYISVTVIALVLSQKTDARSLLLTAMIVIWALRLGSFLFLRILTDGADSRFDKIKPKPLSFLGTWSLQGLWVTVTGGCALAAITSGDSVGLTWFDLGGLTLWTLGFTLEVVADWQKRHFRAAQGSGQFITSGLWSLSRHPNYLGEIMLWLGVALLAMPVLQGWQWVTLISPVFVYLLLTRVSGIPLLEKKADKQWGDDPGYQAYKANTPILLPGLAGKKTGKAHGN